MGPGWCRGRGWRWVQAHMLPLRAWLVSPSFFSALVTAGCRSRVNAKRRLADLLSVACHGVIPFVHTRLLVTSSTIHTRFARPQVTNVRMVSGYDGKPKGFCYAEFPEPEMLRTALELSGQQLAGRTIRISVAEPRKCGWCGFAPSPCALPNTRTQSAALPYDHSLTPGLSSYPSPNALPPSPTPTQHAPTRLVDPTETGLDPVHSLTSQAVAVVSAEEEQPPLSVASTERLLREAWTRIGTGVPFGAAGSHLPSLHRPPSDRDALRLAREENPRAVASERGWEVLREDPSVAVTSLAPPLDLPPSLKTETGAPREARDSYPLLRSPTAVHPPPSNASLARPTMFVTGEPERPLLRVSAGRKQSCAAGCCTLCLQTSGAPPDMLT